MLDRDLAELFEVKSIRLREQVKRNAEKFPVHFMFQLTNEEVEVMVSQNAIPSRQHLGGSLPYVFTEHGVLQLANVSNPSAQIFRHAFCSFPFYHAGQKDTPKNYFL